jgi:hypothetical protein
LDNDPPIVGGVFWDVDSESCIAIQNLRQIFVAVNRLTLEGSRVIVLEDGLTGECDVHKKKRGLSDAGVDVECVADSSSGRFFGLHFEEVLATMFLQV